MTPTLPTRASPNLPGCWQILHWPNGHPTSRVRDPNSVTALPLRDFNPLSSVQWTPNGVHRRITALWTGRHPHTAVTHHPAVLGRLALPRHGTLRLADKPGRACGPDTEFAARQPPGPWPNAAQYRSASADVLRALHGRCKQRGMTVGAFLLAAVYFATAKVRAAEDAAGSVPFTHGLLAVAVHGKVGVSGSNSPCSCWQSPATQQLCSGNPISQFCDT